MKRKLKRTILTLLLIVSALLLIPQSTSAAPRQMESLDRGVVAIKVTTGVLVTWRILGSEWPGVSFNVYRGATKLNAAPITGNSCFQDNAGTTSSTYTVRAIIGGAEQAASAVTSVWANFYKTLTVLPRTNYRLDDVATGDLDGDGQYELVVKRVPNGPNDFSTSGVSGLIIGPNPLYLEAYELDGTFKWAINLGPNASYPIETHFMVYDLDGDGKAEIACQTYDGTVSGTGVSYGDTNGDGRTDYRTTNGSSGSYLSAGPEYFSVFRGTDGASLARANSIPRGNSTDWGDNYWHRATKYLWAVAYLDGVRPSLFFSRGYYAQTKMEAWDFRNGTLTRRWTFSSATAGNGGYAGQGNHQLSVGDVDNDGKDEIVFGAACIDDNGQGLYTTGLNHGDAMHLSDMDPDRPGLEVWDVHETGSIAGGGEFRNARTGALIWGWPTDPPADTGRGLAAHIDANHKGFQFWSSARGGTYNRSNVQIAPVRPNYIFATYWTGSLQREILGGSVLDRWTGTGTSRVVSFYNYESANTIGGTKSHPCLQADLFGDWREELIFRKNDETQLVIFTPNTVTTNRFYTFMHDPTYRLGIAWQNNTYNQPPHAGFYIGAQMAPAPTPSLYYPASGGSLVNGAIYEIEPVHAVGKRLEVNGTSTADGANVHIWQDGNGNNQRWRAVSVTGGRWEFEPQHALGKRLDVFNYETTDGTNVQQYTLGNNAAQRWMLYSHADGSFSLEPECAPGKRLDAYGAGTANGTNAVIWTGNGTGANQRWKFLRQ